MRIQRKYNYLGTNFKPDISAAIIFHHEWFEVERLSEEYFYFYPNGTLILARDHLKPILPNKLKKYNIKLIKSFSCMQSLTELNFNLESASDLSIEHRLIIVKNQINRMYEIARNCAHEFILVLEHDAKIRGRVPIFSDVDLEILEHNPYPKKLLNQIRDYACKEPNFSGWGFVVGTVRKQCAFSIKTWSKSNNRFLQKLVSEYPSMVYLDYLYPILAFLSGYSVANNFLTVECKRDRFWFFRKAPLLHQYSGKNNSHRALAASQRHFTTA